MKSSFLPVINAQSRMVILGSLPGEESLLKKQYYANPRNLFWTIISEVFGIHLPDDYEQRLEFLLSKRVALWDVIAHAERTGSSDNNINSEQPNDFESFFKQHRNICVVLFNGQKAGKVFNKLVLNHQTLPENIQYIILPSSSPANAGVPLANKIQQWRVINNG